MKVNLTIDFPDVYRRAIRYRVGKSGLATRAEVRTYIDGLTIADSETIISEMNEQEHDRAAKADTEQKKCASCHRAPKRTSKPGPNRLCKLCGGWF